MSDLMLYEFIFPPLRAAVLRYNVLCLVLNIWVQTNSNNIEPPVDEIDLKFCYGFLCIVPYDSGLCK